MCGAEIAGGEGEDVKGLWPISMGFVWIGWEDLRAIRFPP
jgi:hypothetical protein